MGVRTTRCRNCGWHGPLEDWLLARRCPACGVNDEAEPGKPRLAKLPHWVKKLIYRDDDTLPGWFITMNMAALLPVLLWPLVLATGVMMFDTGVNVRTASMFLSGVAYPLYLLVIVRLSTWLYKRLLVVAVALPGMLLLAYGYAVLWLLVLQWRT